jgi:hypothetical protein
MLELSPLLGQGSSCLFPISGQRWLMKWYGESFCEVPTRSHPALLLHQHDTYRNSLTQTSVIERSLCCCARTIASE